MLIMKDIYWVGSSIQDLKKFPDEVKQVMGYALHLAQIGGKHGRAKPLKGFKGAGVFILKQIKNWFLTASVFPPLFHLLLAPCL